MTPSRAPKSVTSMCAPVKVLLAALFADEELVGVLRHLAASELELPRQVDRQEREHDPQTHSDGRANSRG